MERTVRMARVALYTELLEDIDGRQPELGGRHITDLSDMKEWLAVRIRDLLMDARDESPIV